MANKQDPEDFEDLLDDALDADEAVEDTAAPEEDSEPGADEPAFSIPDLDEDLLEEAGIDPNEAPEETPVGQPIEEEEVVVAPDPNLPPAEGEPAEDLGFDAPDDELAETPAQKRIRELKAQIADVPAVEPDPEEAEILRLEEELQKKQTARVLDAKPTYAPKPTGETLLLHFLEDGFSACGQVWYRGQELEFEIGSEAYNQQYDRDGNTWLDLIDDIDKQWDRFGKQMFARGPWRGKSWEDIPVPGDITDPAQIEAFKAAVRQASNVERARNRRAPLMTL